MKTRALPPSRATGCGSKCSNSRVSSLRTASGRASHSWTPWRTSVSGVDTSEWQMPVPAVMRLISPGRTVPTPPPESMWAIAPSNSQLTVCSPVCGCGATSMPPVTDTSEGP